MSATEKDPRKLSRKLGIKTKVTDLFFAPFLFAAATSSSHCHGKI
jgi:hypothetical protein